jgi:enterochelin esterase-like enzyme
MVERRRLALLAALPGLALASHVHAAGSEDRGRIIEHTDIPSKRFPNRKVFVWLPPGYQASLKRCSVLYMQDGENLFAPANPYNHGPWDVDGHLLRMAKTGHLRRTMVVGVVNGGLNRGREYEPPMVAERLGPDFRPEFSTDADHGSRADAYLDFLVGELKPFIDRTYRTRPDRKDTLLMGSSKGGLISLYALCRHPEVFGGAACLSTHWIVTTNRALMEPQPSPRLAESAGAWLDWLGENLPRAGRHRLYFDHGSLGLDRLYGPYQLRMDALALARGYRSGHDYLSLDFPGADHNETAWRQRLDRPLGFLLGD